MRCTIDHSSRLKLPRPEERSKINSLEWRVLTQQDPHPPWFWIWWTDQQLGHFRRESKEEGRIILWLSSFFIFRCGSIYYLVNSLTCPSVSPITISSSVLRFFNLIIFLIVSIVSENVDSSVLEREANRLYFAWDERRLSLIHPLNGFSCSNTGQIQYKTSWK